MATAKRTSRPGQDGPAPLETKAGPPERIEDDAAVAAEREFYVGHSYNSMLTLVGTAPYADGTLVFAAVRTFSEKVAGGGLKKSIGRKLVGKKFAERFEKLRAAVEAGDYGDGYDLPQR